METVEAEGSTIDEAIERALQLLGVSRDGAEVEILSNATRGLLGLGGAPAKVRASIRRAIRFEAEAAEEAESGAQRSAGEGEAEAEGPDPESVEKARPILQEIVRQMGVAAEARVETGAEGRHLVLVGDSSGILIGRQGQTLDALEYLVNRIVAREEDSRRRITVDTEGYRARRRAALEQLARKTAARVASTGKSAMLDPMSPRDRRVIHLTLQGDREVGTRSTGEGYYKQVVIAARRGKGSGGGRRG